MAKDMYTKIGSWAFLIGIVIALIVGLVQAWTIHDTNSIDQSFLMDEDGYGGWVAWILAIIGVIVGILAFMGKGTITTKEVPGFLIAGIALVVLGGVFQWYALALKPLIGALLSGISLSISILVAPAVGLLAIKAIWDIGKEV